MLLRREGRCSTIGSTRPPCPMSVMYGMWWCRCALRARVCALDPSGDGPGLPRGLRVRMWRVTKTEHVANDEPSRYYGSVAAVA